MGWAVERAVSKASEQRMIQAPISEFLSVISSVADGTQPATTYGTSITPGASNTYGSYTSVLSGASLTADAYGLEIIVTAAATDATDRGMLVTIGFDPAGGTTFSGLGGVTGNEISNLLCSGADVWYTTTRVGHGCRYYFPVFIKSGTSIGAKAQTNAGTAGTVRVAVNAYCQPSRPDAIRVGSFVRTFGANTTTTDGVAVTQGTVSEGSWTEIGTAADRLWYVDVGVGARTATGAQGTSYSDLGIGDASNKRAVIRNVLGYTTTLETFQKYGTTGVYANVASGDKFYGRSQADAAQSGFSMTAYGVGGG